MTKLLIDDTRVLQSFAKADGWQIIRKGEDLPAWIDAQGWPDAVALDYDLTQGGGIWDGGRVAMWLRNAFEQTGRPTAEFPEWDTHSSVTSCNSEIEETLAPYAASRRIGLAPIRKAQS